MRLRNEKVMDERMGSVGRRPGRGGVWGESETLHIVEQAGLCGACAPFEQRGERVGLEDGAEGLDVPGAILVVAPRVEPGHHRIAHQEVALIRNPTHHTAAHSTKHTASTHTQRISPCATFIFIFIVIYYQLDAHFHC